MINLQVILVSKKACVCRKYLPYAQIQIVPIVEVHQLERAQYSQTDVVETTVAVVRVVANIRQTYVAGRAFSAVNKTYFVRCKLSQSQLIEHIFNLFPDYFVLKPTILPT